MIIPLIFAQGHYFLKLDAGLWLLDTGSPASFGRHGLTIDGCNFNPPTGYVGLDADQLSNHVGIECDGLLGADILNKFDHLFDAMGGTATISSGKLEHQGEALGLQLFMGIPIVKASVAGVERKMFFDTGAQISYFQGDELAGFPPAGEVQDFYPGLGQFQVQTHYVEVTLGGIFQTLKCGSLPPALAPTLMMAGTSGIVGNEILSKRTVGYFPKRSLLSI